MMSAGMPLLAASPEKKDDDKIVYVPFAKAIKNDKPIDRELVNVLPVKEWEKDKVYIFNSWATWCGSCLAAMPSGGTTASGI